LLQVLDRPSDEVLGAAGTVPSLGHEPLELGGRPVDELVRLQISHLGTSWIEPDGDGRRPDSPPSGSEKEGSMPTSGVGHG
jgi:hypothetical protein